MSKLAITTGEELENGPRNLTIMGSPKAGKSHLAATFSASWGQKGVMEDMLWLSCDAGATDFLGPYGLTTPKIDLFGEFHPSGDDVVDVFEEGLDLVANHLVEGKTRAVVVDTWTALDSLLQRYYTESKHAPRNGRGEVDTFAAMRRLNGCYERWYRDLANVCKKANAIVISLMHTKAKPEGMTQEQKTGSRKRLEAGLSASEADFIYQFFYAASGAVFRAHNSLLLTVDVEVDRKTGTRTRHLYTRTTDKNRMEASTRYEGVLDAVEPPDLKALFAKIKEGIPSEP